MLNVQNSVIVDFSRFFKSCLLFEAISNYTEKQMVMFVDDFFHLLSALLCERQLTRKVQKVQKNAPPFLFCSPIKKSDR